MNMPSKKYLIAIENKEEQNTNPTNQHRLITVACLIIFPMIYLIGKTVVSTI